MSKRYLELGYRKTEDTDISKSDRVKILAKCHVYSGDAFNSAITFQIHEMIHMKFISK